MSLKSRIEALTTQISNAKASLRSALSNKGVSVPISPTWDEITQGINDIKGISSGDKYKELIGKGSVFSTNLDTNKTSRKMVMITDNPYSISIRVSCTLEGSIQSALDEINGSFFKGDLVIIATYTIPVYGNYGICIYNLSEDLFSYFGNSTSMENGYPWVENSLFLESVDITPINNGRYDFSFIGYALKMGKSPVD